MRKIPGTFQKVIRGVPYWVARYHFPADTVTGERKTPKDFYAKTQREADAKRKAWVAQYELNPRADTSATFGDYITNEFIPHEQARTQLQVTSPRKLSFGKYSERKSRLTKFAKGEKPFLQTKRLCATLIADLEPRQFKAYLESIEANLSPSLFNKIRQDLKLVLKELKGRTRYAPSTFFDYFPAKGNETPKAKVLDDPDDVLRKIKDPQYPLEHRALVAGQFTMQARPQELVALTWADVDLEAGTATINKRLQLVAPAEGEERKTAFEVTPGTKTGAKGVRTIYLGPLMCGLLRELRKAHMNTVFVFPYIDGTLLSKMRLRRLWATIKKTMELKTVQFYHLKTLGNSYLLSKGVSASAQAARMGHTTTAMAEGAYRNPLDAEQRAAAEVFGT